MHIFVLPGSVPASFSPKKRRSSVFLKRAFTFCLRCKLLADVALIKIMLNVTFLAHFDVIKFKINNPKFARPVENLVKLVSNYKGRVILNTLASICGLVAFSFSINLAHNKT